MRFSGIILLLLFSGSLIADPITEGGNVSETDFDGIQNSTYWNGFYGEIVLGAGTTYNVNAVGNQVTELNMVAQNPPCTYSSIRMHIISVNATGISGGLSAGNLAALDAFIGGSENGSATFNSTSTFQLTYGTIAGVPTTYTNANNATSPDFRMGYLNDALGNLVFAAVVVDNRPNWNGSTSDYQIMLPNNGGVVQYTVWVDVNYTCQPNVTPGEDDNDHIIYIPPIGTVSFTSGEPFGLDVTVENRGDYREDNVFVHITDCPAGFSCGTFTIPHIVPGGERDAVLPITGGPAGTYVLEVCAESESGADYCREFILVVLPECAVNADCPEGEYCEGGVCVEKKNKSEECTEDYECISRVCESGRCAECISNADCAYDEVCISGVCRKVECACGYISSHACVQYECCADADCKSMEFCIEHRCVPKELEIVIIEGTMVEGDPLFVQVVDNRGNGVDEAKLSADERSWIADQNGFATITTPYYGIIYGEKEGYGKVGKIIDVVRLGFFVFEEKVYVGEETEIALVDTRGRPIPAAEATMDGGKYVTDGEGRVFHTFWSTGEKIIKGKKTGYIIRDGALMVYGRGAPEGCSFPVVLGLIIFTPGQTRFLWLAALVVASANFFLFRGRTGASNAKSFVYCFAPLALAIPDAGLLSICFMSNVVLLQLVAEVLLAAKKSLKERMKKAKGEGGKSAQKK